MENNSRDESYIDDSSMENRNYMAFTASTRSGSWLEVRTMFFSMRLLIASMIYETLNL